MSGQQKKRENEIKIQNMSTLQRHNTHKAKKFKYYFYFKFLSHVRVDVLALSCVCSLMDGEHFVIKQLKTSWAFGLAKDQCTMFKVSLFKCLILH